MAQGRDPFGRPGGDGGMVQNELAALDVGFGLGPVSGNVQRPVGLVFIGAVFFGSKPPLI